MSRSGAFCPRCGDPIEGAPERPPGEPRDPDDSLCLSCYLDSFDLVDAPERVRVRVCAQCGAVRKGNRWVDVDAEDYSDVAIEAVSDALGVHVEAEGVGWEVATEQADPSTIRAHVRFTGTVRDVPVTEELTIPVDIAKETCTRCGKIAGGSYASIVQLRATDRHPSDEEIQRTREIAEDVVGEMAATGDREAFVTDHEETADGLDLKVSTNKIGLKIAKRVVDELGGSYADAPTLVTEDADGNEVYRVTYAIHLPPFRPGAIIDPRDDEGPVLVRGADRAVTGTRLATGEPFEKDVETVTDDDAERIGTRADAQDTVVVAVEDENAVQVLDPETYEAKTVPRPDYLDADADEVPVLKSHAGLHILPDTDAETDTDE
jgi:nonsense-mediated mRNA decay protein 3